MAIIRYILKKKNIKTVSIALIFILFCINTYAQEYKLTNNNESLSQALIKASKQFNIKVAFDAQKLGTIIVHKQIEGRTVDEFLHNLLSDFGLDFQYKHGTYLVVGKDPQSDNAVSEEYQIIGSITDKETGEQLPMATVSIPDQNYNIAASANGSFFIKNKASKSIHLNISYIGYYQIDTIINFKKATEDCVFKLNKKSQAIDTVIVKGPKIDMIEYRNDVDFAITINPAKLSDLPILTETDIFKSLQLLPGISYSENSSELSIRGGSSDQNLVLYDGQTLYNLSHYYGMFSSLNPNIIKDIQVYRGGYDSRYGERVSGIIDITSKTGNQLKPTIYGDINLLSGNIAAEIPLNKKLTVVLTGRRSYSDIYSTEFANNLFRKNTNPVLKDPRSIISQSTPTFYFYDYNSKLTYRINNKENLSLSIYGGKDYYDNKYNVSSDSLRAINHDNNSWSNYGISAAWLKQWNGPFFSNLQIGTSGYINKYTSTTVLEDPIRLIPNKNYLPNQVNYFNSNNENKLTDFFISLRNTWYLNNTNQLNFGFLTRQNSIYYHKDADKVYVYDNTNQKSWVYSAYVQDRILLFDRLTIKPGMRLSLYDGTKKWYVEPRFAADYKFSDMFSIRFATGHFCQFINQVVAQQDMGYTKNFWVLADNRSHPVVTSNHFIVGSTYEKGNVLIDAEAYYKNYTGLQEYLYVSQFVKNADFHNYFPPNNNGNQGQNPTPKPSYYINGKGKSYGIDLSIRYKYGNFTSWISYSLSKSVHQFSDLLNNKEFPAPNDQRHQLSLANMVSVNKWNFGTTTLFSTGKPYIDFTNNNKPIPTTRVYKRLPNYFRTDLSANYNFLFLKTKFKVGATIINIFNTLNYFDINTRKFDFENTSFSDTNIIRAQKLSFNLFLHFEL
ncbi:MAG: TonB-dependent receptor [Bacteroidetes bacterium]|nr:TonB-dependent receptor [Bacteroidota bacterium]